MSEALQRLSAPGKNRLAGIVLVALSVLVGAFFIARETLGRFSGGGVDVSDHYALVYWFSHHWSLPPAQYPMAGYPPAAHILAALVGRVVGSPFRGMQLVAIAAIVVIWCAICALLTILPARRRWVALGALALFFVLDWSSGPLQIEVHGFEIIGNFFFAQAVSQAIVWWVVWFAARHLAAGRSPLFTAVPAAVLAVLTTEVFLLASVELLVFAGCLCAYEFVVRWRTGRRLTEFVAPVALPAAAAILIVLSPEFAVMRGIAANNGALGVHYFSGLAGYIGVAVATGVVSLLLLAVAARRAREKTTRAVLRCLGFLGIAIAVPCLLEAVALTDGQGSPYAVKKYIFGLLTVLVVDACAIVAALLPRLGLADHRRSHQSTRVAAIIACAALATLSVFSHAGPGYSMSAMTTLEHHVNDFASAAHVRGNGRAFAIALPESNPLLDFMYSMSVFGAPYDSVVSTVLGGQPDLAMAEFVTGSGSEFDIPACRRFGPRDGLVVVGTACWRQAAIVCSPTYVFGANASPYDFQLSGFSYAEPYGRWTDSTTAALKCLVSRSEERERLTVAIDVTAFVPFASSRQSVTLAARGVQRRFLLTGHNPNAALQITVPPSASRWLDLTIRLPDAASPNQLGVSGDTRTLGLFVSGIQIGSVACHSAYVLGAVAPYDPELSGFSSPQLGGRWTDSTTAALKCLLPRSEARERLTIAIDATAFVPFASSRQSVTLAARGVQKRFLLTAHSPNATLQITVPPSASRWLDLTIRLPDAVSPKQLGVSADPRTLGVFVTRIDVG